MGGRDGRRRLFSPLKTTNPFDKIQVNSHQHRMNIPDRLRSIPSLRTHTFRAAFHGRTACLVENPAPTGSGGILPPSKTCGAAAMPSIRLARLHGFSRFVAAAPQVFQRRHDAHRSLWDTRSRLSQRLLPSLNHLCVRNEDFSRPTYLHGPLSRPIRPNPTGSDRIRPNQA